MSDNSHDIENEFPRNQEEIHRCEIGKDSYRFQACNEEKRKRAPSSVFVLFLLSVEE